MKLSTVLRIGGVATLTLAARAQQLLSTSAGNASDEYGAAEIVIADQNADGFADVLVGAPGFNGGRGYIRCLSGQFLATGVGAAVLWTLAPTVNAGARFGASLAETNSLTGSSAKDFLVGAPGIVTGSLTTGAVFLVDGATHAIADEITGENNTHFGQSVVTLGDQNGDGLAEFVVNAPAILISAPSWVHFFSGTAFAAGNTATTILHDTLNETGTAHAWGDVLAGGFDIDHDGFLDFAIGSPQFNSTGMVEILSYVDLLPGYRGFYSGQQAGERMGASIDGGRDFDEDGFQDVVIGAPDWTAGTNTHDGRVVVMSGALFLQPPASGGPELFELKFGDGSQAPATYHFGAAVHVAQDLNGDGTPDILAGAPDYFGSLPVAPAEGAVVAFSGETGARLGAIVGAVNDHLGNALLGSFIDLNADGFRDFAVAGSSSDNPAVDCGVLEFYSLFPSAPTSYCTAKINSLGCTPTIGSSGLPSASSSAPFLVTCANQLNQKSGLFFYSHAPNAIAFQGGTLCAKPPLLRTPVQNSGGSAGGSDCTGAFSFDFGARIASGVDPTLVAGAEVFIQCWARDPASASTTSLSNALHLVIGP
jgi:hypothetical protein